MVSTYFFLHVMQMISMGIDLANTITEKSPLTITKVYFALTSIVPLEITKLSSSRDSFHSKFQVMQKESLDDMLVYTKDSDSSADC